MNTLKFKFQTSLNQPIFIILMLQCLKLYNLVDIKFLCISHLN